MLKAFGMHGLKHIKGYKVILANGRKVYFSYHFKTRYCIRISSVSKFMQSRKYDQTTKIYQVVIIGIHKIY